MNKLMKALLLFAAMLIVLSLLVSCGDTHGDGCDCEECATNPDNHGDGCDCGECTDDDVRLYTDLGRYDPTVLRGVVDETFATEEDMEWLMNFVSFEGKDYFDEQTRANFLTYLEGLPEDFLDKYFLHVLPMEIWLMEEGSFKAYTVEGGNIVCEFTVKEEYHLVNNWEETYGKRVFENLVAVCLDRELYFDGVEVNGTRDYKLKDSVTINLEGNEADPALLGKDAEYRMATVVHNVLGTDELLKGYFYDVTALDKWGFSAVIDTKEKLSELLHTIGTDATVEQELAAIGIEEGELGQKLLLPILSATYPTFTELKYTIEKFSVGNDGVLEIFADMQGDYCHSYLCPNEANPLTITYLVVDRALIDGVVAIHQVFYSFPPRRCTYCA